MKKQHSTNISIGAACELSLLQLLFMLPVDTLRNSFLAQLPAKSLGSLRLTCKQAARLVHEQFQSLRLRVTPQASLIHVANFISHFSALTRLSLSALLVLGDSNVCQLFHSSRIALQAVTRLTWQDQPFNFSTSLAISVACPKLSVLKLLCCPLDYTTSVFAPLASITKVSLFCCPPFYQGINAAILSLFALPQLQKLSAKGTNIPLGAVKSSSLIKLKLPDTCELNDYSINLLATNVPQLTALQVLSVDLAGQVAGRLPNLTHLLVEDGLHIVDLALLLPQPQLKSIRIGQLYIREYDEHVPFAQWPVTTFCEVLSLLERIYDPASPMPNLQFSSMGTEDALEFAESLPMLPRFSETLEFAEIWPQGELVQLLINKLPNLKSIQMSDCYGNNLDSVLTCFLSLKQLTSIGVLRCNNISGAALAMLAACFGSQAVTIIVDDEALGSADLGAINAMLSSITASSRFIL